MADQTDAGPSAARRAAAQYVRMSTDQQRNSIENQKNAIAEFAESNGYRIVQTYADPGLSGLTLRDRPGLQQLLTDAEDRPSFSAVLVYDVSRLGRFQELDEAAAYEFHLRVHGVEVVYCVEQFDNSGGPVNALLKHMRRSMAAEYSRDLSLRITRAKRLSASQGYWAGGSAPFGYERWAVAPDGQRIRLKRGDRRYAYLWRTKLEPGPPDEVATVQRIFGLYTSRRRTLREIAKDLNAHGWTRRNGDVWHGEDVRLILANPVYGGQLAYGRTSQSMKSAKRLIPESAWIRVVDAFPPIVAQKTVEKARTQLRARRRPSNLSDEEMLSMLRDLLRKHGRLSYNLVNADKTVPSAAYYVQRFGTIGEAFALAGYAPHYRIERVDRMRRINQMRTTLTGNLRLNLAATGINTRPLGPNHFEIGSQTATCLPMVRATYGERQLWRGHVPERWIDLLVLARLADEHDEPLDYRIVRRADVKQGHLYLSTRLHAISTAHRTIEEATERLIVIAGGQTSPNSSLGPVAERP